MITLVAQLDTMCHCGDELNTAVENLEEGRTNQLAVVCKQCGAVIERIDG